MHTCDVSVACELGYCVDCSLLYEYYIVIGEYIGELIGSLDGVELKRVIGLVSALASAVRWVWFIGIVTCSCVFL